MQIPYVHREWIRAEVSIFVERGMLLEKHVKLCCCRLPRLQGRVGGVRINVLDSIHLQAQGVKTEKKLPRSCMLGDWGGRTVTTTMHLEARQALISSCAAPQLGLATAEHQALFPSASTVFGCEDLSRPIASSSL